ncbi:MAG: hypothetical protein WCK73_04840 [Deltaproteobacteria bacterium]
MRTLVAIGVAVMLLLGVAAPHHHAPAGGTHECVACTVGGALEARDATPQVVAPAPVALARVTSPAREPVTGFPLGAVPGQSPPHA